MKTEECAVLDLHEAGVQLAASLDRLHTPLNANNAARVEYSLAGLAAAGAWVLQLNDEGGAHRLATQVALSTSHVGVRLFPVIPSAFWRSKSENEIAEFVDQDIDKVKREFHSFRRWTDIAAHEVLCLVIIAELCRMHGSEALYLTSENWSVLTSLSDPEQYRLCQQYIASGQLCDEDLGQKTATWISRHYLHADLEGFPSETVALTAAITGALNWVQGFFRTASETHRAAMPVVMTRSLGKASMPYTPVDRRLTARF